jgi:hypothetical protein
MKVYKEKNSHLYVAVHPQLVIEEFYNKKVSENETRMYTLCTFNGKELDTGHNSSPNSELSYCNIYFNTDL